MNQTLHWTLYLRSGPIEIWEGRPARGSWITYEVRNTATGETREIEPTRVLDVFEKMLPPKPTIPPPPWKTKATNTNTQS